MLVHVTSYHVLVYHSHVVTTLVGSAQPSGHTNWHEHARPAARCSLLSSHVSGRSDGEGAHTGGGISGDGGAQMGVTSRQDCGHDRTSKAAWSAEYPHEVAARQS